MQTHKGQGAGDCADTQRSEGWRSCRHTALSPLQPDHGIQVHSQQQTDPHLALGQTRPACGSYYSTVLPQVNKNNSNTILCSFFSFLTFVSEMRLKNAEHHKYIRKHKVLCCLMECMAFQILNIYKY